jgi:hypothetical protein
MYFTHTRCLAEFVTGVTAGSAKCGFCDALIVHAMMIVDFSAGYRYCAGTRHCSRIRSGGLVDPSLTVVYSPAISAQASTRC